MRWVDALNQDMRFFNELCYFLAAEQMQHYILGAMKAESPAPDMKPGWRGSLLRGVVRALLDVDAASSADPAIDTFFQVVQERKQHRLQHGHIPKHGDSYGGISLVPALFELCGQLATGSYENTSPEKHRALMDFYERSIQRVDEYDKRWTLAVLSLHMPGSPNPDPAMGLLKAAFDAPASEAVRRRVLASLTHNRGRLYMICLSLESALSAQGRSGELQWVENLRASRFDQKEARQYLVRLNPKVALPGSKVRITRAPAHPRSSAAKSSWHHTLEKASRVHKTGS